jgi:hypothetical protein
MDSKVKQLQRQVQDLEILNNSLIKMNAELEAVIRRQAQLLGKCSCSGQKIESRKRDTMTTLVEGHSEIWEDESTAMSLSDANPDYLDDPYLDSPFSIQIAKGTVQKYCFDRHQDFEFSSSVS